MSRYIEEVDGKYITTLADKHECKHCYNDVCCNDKSEHLADFVGLKMELHCHRCKLFEKEDLEC